MRNQRRSPPQSDGLHSSRSPGLHFLLRRPFSAMPMVLTPLSMLTVEVRLRRIPTGFPFHGCFTPHRLEFSHQHYSTSALFCKAFRQKPRRNLSPAGMPGWSLLLLPPLSGQAALPPSGKNWLLVKLDYGSKPFLAAPTLLSGPVGADGVLLSAGALGIIEVEAVLPVCVKPVCPA